MSPMTIISLCFLEIARYHYRQCNRGSGAVLGYRLTDKSAFMLGPHYGVLKTAKRFGTNAPFKVI